MNGPPPRSAETSDFYSCIHPPSSSSSSSTRIDALTSGVCGRPRRTWQTLFIHSKVVLWAYALHTEHMGVRSNTSACVRRCTAKAPLPATGTTKHIHTLLRTAVRFSRTTRLPDTQSMQVSSPCHARRTVRAANLSCSWASFPCLMPKRPPSRWGKVASNLVSLLYHRCALVRSGSLAHGGRSSTRDLSLHHTHWKS